jgi:hypothetical protein
MKWNTMSGKTAQFVFGTLVMVAWVSIAAQQQPAFDSPPAYLKFEKQECPLVEAPDLSVTTACWESVRARHV